jgi:phage terminase small subunit
MPKLTAKQEKFALYIFQDIPQRVAWGKAGYSTKYSMAIIDTNASILANSNKIKLRLAELRKKKEDAAIANVQERQERLTEILRAKLTDFMEMGQDGSWINIGKETPLSGAIQEMHSTTEYDKDGSKPTVVTSVKLHDPIRAIDLLNKMDKLYSEGTEINIDNRKVEIFVTDKETKQLAERLIGGELPEAKADNDIQG